MVLPTSSRIGLFMVLFSFLASFAMAQDKSAAEYIQAGKDLEGQRKYKEAAEQYEFAALVEPKNAEAYYLRGNMQMKLNETTKALGNFEKAIKLNPEHDKAYAGKALVYMHIKDYDKAFAAFDEAFTHCADAETKAGYKSIIVSTLDKNDRFSEAAPYIAAGLGAKADEPNLLYYDGKFKNDKKDFEGASKSLEKAESYFANKPPQVSARFYYELAYAYHELGQPDKLDKVLPKAAHGPYKADAIKLTPKYQMSLAQSFYDVFDFEQSLEYLNGILKRRPGFGPAQSLKGKILEGKGDKSSIKEVIEKVIVSTPNPIEKGKKYEELAHLEYGMGNYAAAGEAASYALKVDKKKFDMYVLQPAAEFKAGDPDKALATIEEGLKYPAMSELMKDRLSLLKGIILKEKGDTENAKKTLKGVREGHFKYTALYYLEALGEKEAAE